MAQQLKAKALGDALISFLSAGLTSLNLVSCGWAPGMRGEPLPPAKPSADCPMLRLRLFTVEAPRGLPQNATLYDYTWGLYYYRQQTPTQSHQTLLVDDMEVIHDLFAGVLWQPPGLVAVSGQSFYYVQPRQLVIHNEIPHPLVDDPAQRVSCGELVLTMQSKSTS